jgi:hypothetical protein
MKSVKRASKTIIVSGTPRSHRIPALAMDQFQLMFSFTLKRQMDLKVPLRAKDLDREEI